MLAEGHGASASISSFQLRWRWFQDFSHRSADDRERYPALRLGRTSKMTELLPVAAVAPIHILQCLNDTYQGD